MNDFSSTGFLLSPSNAFWVSLRAIPDLLVLFHRLDASCRREFLRWWKLSILMHDRIDLAGTGLIHSKPLCEWTKRLR